MKLTSWAPLEIIKCVAPLLGTDPNRSRAPGCIVNIRSVPGKIGYPCVGAYAVSKHALEGAWESPRREPMPYGIDLILYAPGIILVRLLPTR